MAGTPGAVTPYPLAMVICDGIWRDPYTGKLTLIGTFSATGGESFPLFLPTMAVYASLTDGRGIIPIRLELTDVDEDRDPIFVVEQEREFNDPRMMLDLCFMLQGGVVFPEPGEYRLKLFANNEFILERRIVVNLMREAT